ncbi:SDR family oxidoreductase [Halioxenophilus sp. WMMB6]|uniref:SDR family NAD(P)-dependent oxidoreductase n=1 Tax=Halioxenophilus sp. WMMB6 TaxID=3073815 RepID=UPI00295E30FC|nr:SDR family oxidoreductase [Halioxenophilus sp. WMMB6]
MAVTSFNDRVVLITGAASGFGKLLAESLADMGAKLALADLNEAGVAAVADQLVSSKQCEVIYQACDVSKEVQVEAFVSAAVSQFGRLDIAVNNAGISGDMKSLIDVTEADMDLNFAVNAKGVLFGMKYQIRQMLQQEGGVILNVASMAGINGAPRLAPYCAAKHAVVGLTKTAAVEYGRNNIRCNAVCPYFSHTPMIADSPIMQREELFAQASPMKRLGEAHEIVQAMLMLMAPENSYLNGQAIAVDGGKSSF